MVIAVGLALVARERARGGERSEDVGDIDRLFFDDPFIVLPTGAAATDAYTMIRAWPWGAS